MEDTARPADDGPGLREKLAAVLPDGHRFGIHHVSTPPTKTDALYPPPPGERPDRTYCEQHFLAVSIDAAESPRLEPQQVLVLGIEIFIYTTAHSTTLFVSKADSTGYLHRLGLPRGAPSPIRHVCATLIRHLVDQRRRKGVQLVVSLFARAQDQYLFPGSIGHDGKHVLDDRGLVRWWCRVLDPLIESPPGAGRGGGGSVPAWENVEGYLVVPGLDAHETRALVPRRAGAAKAWTVQRDPLERISHYRREFDWVPPRCLIPRFPDDPKSRFRDELDGEADGTGGMRKTGSWKTVKTLDVFWEMMAFRQECSSGRMTGFIWVVFDDLEGEAIRGSEKKAGAEEGEKKQAEAQEEDEVSKADATRAPETPKSQRIINITPTTTPRRLVPRKNADGAHARPKRDAEARKPFKPRVLTAAKNRKRRRTRLRGPIVPRQPRIKTRQRNHLLDRPASTAYYYWPAQGRGDKIVAEADYKRMLELLLHLDFATLDKAVSSTRRWVSEVGLGRRWGYEVAGTKRTAPALSGEDGGGGGGEGSRAAAVVVNNLSGLVKRKRSEAAEMVERGAKVNVLGGGLVRRKAKDKDGPGGAV